MRTTPARFPFLVSLLLASVPVGCSEDEGFGGASFEAPETAVTYEVALEGLPTEEMTELATGALAVYRQQDDGAQSIAFLKRRAENDVATLKKILRSRGYYKSQIDVSVLRVETPQADAISASNGERSPEQATVAFRIAPGPAFTLARHDFVSDDPSGTAPALVPAEFGSPVGAAAEASPIVDAETAAIDTLQRYGFPYATRGKRRAVADLEAATLEIDTPIATGPAATFGDVAFLGLEDVRERYLRTYVPWTEGDTFDLSKLRAYQQALIATDLFETVSVKPPPTAPENPGPAPLAVTVKAEERPFRTVSAGARYTTDEGPSVTGGFQHRNLWGENETLTVEAELGVPLQRFGVGYREPQYQRPGQDLIGSISVKREEDDAFDDLTATARLGIERRLSRRWTVGVGGLLEASFINDAGGDAEAYLAGIPGFARYDRTDDPLDPTKGERLLLELTPYAGVFDGAFAGFLTADAIGSAYYDLTGEKAYILAGRARLGTILAEDVDNVPQTRRLYSGGGGSVRGYAQRFIGPLDAQNDPEGGLSAVELGGEIRARLYGDLGGTLFVEAGSVSQQSWPDFADGVQLAGGVGFRYYSPAGPIRVDLALPLNPRDADDAFQFYFSIGQAF